VPLGTTLKHVQVREYVRSLIADLPEGAPAPSERDLMQHFGVARMTVRQAIDALVAEGLLERAPARGTFVCKNPRPVTRPLSFTEDARARGWTTTTETLAHGLGQAGPGVAKAMGITAGDAVIHWRRRRRLDDVPLCVQDVYLNATQALPGATQEVHHILVYMDDAQESLLYEGKDGKPGYDCFGSVGLQSLSAGSYLGSWVPGSRVQRLDAGLGFLLKANSRVVVQVHYHPSGRPSADQTALGLYLAPSGSVQHRMLAIPIVNTDFTIPAGESAYPVSATLTIPKLLGNLSGKIVQVGPHMHLLGRQISLDLVHADKSVTPLIAIDDWDFNWQSMYTLTDQLPFVSGDTVRVNSIFDNSEGNPKNPNKPLVPVSWGEGTTDEMVVGYVGVFLDQEALSSLFLQSVRHPAKRTQH